jgi:hypothetical protein
MIKRYKDFLLEDINYSDDEHKFEKNKEIGWWGDKDHVDVYHGTHKKNLDSIRKNGLDHPDSRTGKISVTPDPHTAHAYAAMSGGEANFRKVGHAATTTPHEDRVVTKFRIPTDWLKKHMDHDFGGNVGIARDRISSKEHYDKWKKENPERQDHEYYSTTEFRIDKHVPPEFYAGHSFKVKK